MTTKNNYDPNVYGPMQPQQPDYVPDQLIIKFKEGVTSKQINALGVQSDAVSVQTVSLTHAQIWHLSPSISVEDAIAKYSKSGLVEYVEPDYIIRLNPTETASSTVHTVVAPQVTTPNDPMYNQLWGLNNTGQSSGTVDADIDAPEAWDMQTGNPTLVIGVIDTGVDYTHPDLVGNIWTNPGEVAGDGIDNDGNGYVDDIHGWDFVNHDNSPMDDVGHGTHVSGTIAGKGNNGIGVTGVAWNAQIMPLKFLGTNGGSNSDAILAIDYATTKGVKITNNSWGGGSYSQALYDAINSAGQQGALFIAAAGNGGADGIGDNNDTTPDYPASFNLANIISVAATTRTDGLAPFSNYGATSVDLGAPGLDILSTFPVNGSPLGQNYGTISGTSMATPHVSGAAALLWSQHPTWTAQQVKNTLMFTTDAIPALAGKAMTGRLNINTALHSSGDFPTITLSVNPANVAEDGAGNLTYSFTRSGDVTNPLTVNFSVAGTANASAVGSDPADYALLTSAGVAFNPTTKTGTVTFAAGANSNQLVIDPTADTVAEDQNEAAIVTVTGGGSYISGASVTGSIVSEEVTPVFSNPASITIPVGGSATPYPSSITVSGLSGYVANIKVNLLGLSHTWPDDIDMFLLGPQGQKVMLMSDAGGGYDLSNVNLNFTDSAVANLPVTQITAGSYRPTDYETGDVFPAPAPAGPYGTSLASFNGTQPNGSWQLFAYDDVNADGGAIAGGWSLAIQTSETPPPPPPPPPIIAATDTGWYDNTGFHDSTNMNYAVGDDHRDWMSFTLPTFSLPVATAALQIKTYNYFSVDASETFELHEVSTPVSTLVAGGLGLTGIYNDLADGPVYGSRSFSSANSNQTITIDLNASLVAALNSKSGQAFALGGLLSSLDNVAEEGIFGGSGFDPATDVQLLLTYGAATETQLSEDDDIYTDTNQSQFIAALAGDDIVYGRGGNDTLTGDANDDLLNGGSGNDALYAGSTTGLAATDGINRLFGGSGDDTLYSGADDDVLNGGSNTDTVSYALATGAVQVSLALKTWQDTGAAGEDQLIAIENLIGSLAGDSLTGNIKANVLTGGAGNDSLNGGAGADTAVFTGNTSDYSFSRDDSGNLVVTDSVASRNGVDVLNPNVETVQFANQSLPAADLGFTTSTHGRTDFNGDGKSDLLLTHTDGSVRAITLNGLAISADAVVYNAAATSNGAWQVLNSKGDYNGDGKTDLLLWNSSTSSAKVTFMNGAAISSDGLIDYAQNKTGWTIADSSADYNKDGKSDLLLWNSSTSTVNLYLQNGTTASSSVQLFTGVTGWAVQSAGGDYNGDGNSDILFWNQSSSLAYMLTMNGVTVTSQGAISLPSSAWSIVDAKGDYNGDAKSDMLLRNASTGELWEYQMNGTTISSSASVAVVDNAWQVISAHNDFNGDGKADILSKHTDGSAWISLVDGNSITSSVSLGAYSGWTVQNADNDVNGDGKADVLWKHSDGSVYIMEMNGTSVIAGGALGPFSGWNNTAAVPTPTVADSDFTVALTGIVDPIVG